MAWQQYQYSSWTPVAAGEGDFSLASPPFYGEETSYHGSSGLPSGMQGRPPLTSDNESYEMDDRRSYISSAPLLQPDGTSVNKSSIREPSIRESIGGGLDRRRRQLSGWKIGVMACAATAATVGLLNISLTVWAVTNHELINGISYLYTGSCSEVANMSLWIHLGINAMSTLLLSASNYTMQVISSPTRKEVNKAHAKSKWLDIGVPSTRNLRAISGARIFMWTILGLSSIPLHLMYNTAVFSSLSANAYDYFVVSEDFFSSSVTYNVSKIGDDYYDYSIGIGVLDAMHVALLNGTLKNTTSSQCMEAYGINFVSKSRNVLLVTTDADTSNNSLLYAGTWSSWNEVPYAWICGDGWSQTPYSNQPPSAACTIPTATAAASNWIVGSHHISYCMVQEVVEECQLSFSLLIMLVVISVNAAKTCIMILTVWKLKEPTLVTIGDAVASFLCDPDPTTKGICLSTKSDIQNKKWKLQPIKPWNPTKHFWFRAASIKRWLTCNILCIGVIGFGIYLLQQGMATIEIYNIKDLYALGFGSVNSNSVVGVAPTGLIATTLFANLPQGILSFLYLTYNGLFTCMLGSYEWSRFARFHKPLRVTAPIESQRSTYYLQLPYTYAIPLLVMSGSLHWLMSQSLFLALVTVYDDTGLMDTGSSISTVGYSCIAIFCALILGSMAVLGGLLNGFRRYDDGTPLVGSCSAAISAACHRPNLDAMAYVKPVMWGVIDADADEGRGSGVGHCCLSSFQVGKPVKGHLYAGMKRKEA